MGKVTITLLIIFGVLMFFSIGFLLFVQFDKPKKINQCETIKLCDEIFISVIVISIISICSFVLLLIIIGINQCMDKYTDIEEIRFVDKENPHLLV